MELSTREKYLLLSLSLSLSCEDYSDALRAAMFISNRQFFFSSYGDIRAYNWRERARERERERERERRVVVVGIFDQRIPPSSTLHSGESGVLFCRHSADHQAHFSTSPLQHRCLRVQVPTHTDAHCGLRGHRHNTVQACDRDLAHKLSIRHKPDACGDGEPADYESSCVRWELCKG